MLVAAFNHACLDDLGHIGTDEAAARLSLVARCAEVIRRGRGGLPIRISRHFGSTEVGSGERFVSWANRQGRDARIADALQLLLNALQGPFVSDLDVSGTEPVEILPAIDGLSRSDLFELLMLLLHHGLTTGARLWLLSLPPDAGVSSPEYVARRAPTSEARLQNLRSLGEVEQADRALAAADVGTHADVLATIEGRFPRIVLLAKAHRGLRQFVPDCTPALLRDTFEAFEVFGSKIDAGEPEDDARRAFKVTCTVEMSHESRKTLAQPSLRTLREAKVEGRTEVFSLHAKPGYSMRVYVFPRKETHPDEPARVWTRIYVGYCGKHLRTD